MDKVYQQEGKRCVGYAIANAIHDKLNIEISNKQISDYYDLHFGGDKGVAIEKFLMKMRKHPFAGVTCSYSTIMDKNKKDVSWVSRFRQATLEKSKAVVCSLRVRDHKKGEQQIELDKNGFLIPKKTSVISYHAILCKGLANRLIWQWRTKYLFENSWGKDWGKDGFFYIAGEDLHTELEKAYAITFTYAPASIGK